jgi:hypothetical protein
VVAKEITSNKYERVILVTDGEVDDNDVQSCDEILKDFKFAKTICYIITNTNNVNMSVTCPFTRNCANEVYQKRPS